MWVPERGSGYLSLGQAWPSLPAASRAKPCTQRLSPCLWQPQRDPRRPPSATPHWKTGVLDSAAEGRCWSLTPGMAAEGGLRGSRRPRVLRLSGLKTGSSWLAAGHSWACALALPS